MKNIVILLVLSLSSLAAKAENKMKSTFYLKADVNAQYSDEAQGNFSEIKSNTSWVGLKGEAPLDSGLKAIYRFEWGMNITSEQGQDSLTERPQYLGISNPYGSITLGRNFTALWMAQGRTDLFNAYEGDIRRLWHGENRLSDVATLTSASWNKLQARLTYQAEKSPEGEAATSLGIYYGDRNLKASNTYAAIAQDFNVVGSDITRINVQTKMGAGKLGLMLQKEENSSVANSSRTGGLVSYLHRINKIGLLSQLQTMEKDSALSLGVEYYVGSSTKIYGWLTQVDEENTSKSHYYSIGLEHRLANRFNH